MLIDVMRITTKVISSLLIMLIFPLLGSGFVYADEMDDANIFVDAFAAYQKKDYLLAIEKADHLNQLFPDSALRDVVLLLTARSNYKAGDNGRAAKAVTKFIKEYPESSLKLTIEEELLTLSSRQQKGEVLPPNKQLQSAALKVRNDRLAQERLAALKLEQERLAKENAERERIAYAKAEAERRARELAAAEKAAKESIKFVINIRDGGAVTVVGESGRLPVEISNRGSNNEEIILDVVAPAEYGALLASETRDNEAVTRIKLAVGETFKGNLLFRMPTDRVDGSRTSLTVRATSAKYSDVAQQKSTFAIASAPLIRALAKLGKPKTDSGEQLYYKVSVLNIGSVVAQKLTIRIQLPPQLDFQGATDIKYTQEADGSLVFMIERIEIGRLAQIQIGVKERGNGRSGQQLQGQIEVVNSQLQRKDMFAVKVAALQVK